MVRKLLRRPKKAETKTEPTAGTVEDPRPALVESGEPRERPKEERTSYDELRAGFTAVVSHRANRRVVKNVLELGSNSELVEWGLRMIVVSRCLERIGDHAVDIGEQTAYLVTGEFREFTDASHTQSS